MYYLPTTTCIQVVCEREHGNLYIVEGSAYLKEHFPNLQEAWLLEKLFNEKMG